MNIFRPVSYSAGRGWHLRLAFVIATSVAIVDVVYLLGFLRPFTVTAVLASIILALGIAFHTAATWDKDEDLWEAIGIIATGPLFLLHKNFNWAGFVPKLPSAKSAVHLGRFYF